VYLDFTAEGVDQEFPKKGLRQRAWGRKSLVGSGGKVEKCEISAQFLVFLQKKLGFNEYSSRARTVFLCKHIFQKYSKDLTGV